MLTDRPTLYLSNWSSHRTPGHHGPGRKLTIMAAPRKWEHGDGVVEALVPDLADLDAVKHGEITVDEYHERFEVGLAEAERNDVLQPGRLVLRRPPINPLSLRLEAVGDGDTLCCACSREDAAAGRCHRAWAAAFLVRAGWRVVLDGVEVPA